MDAVALPLANFSDSLVLFCVPILGGRAVSSVRRCRFYVPLRGTSPCCSWQAWNLIVEGTLAGDCYFQRGVTTPATCHVIIGGYLHRPPPSIINMSVLYCHGVSYALSKQRHGGSFVMPSAIIQCAALRCAPPHVMCAAYLHRRAGCKQIN